MRIGIFGDSFADVTSRNLIDESLGRRPWPLTLARLFNSKISPYGAVATSTWYSYKKFLNEYKNMDIVVFCYSSNDRWHTINVGNGAAPIHHIIAADQLSNATPEYKDVAQQLVDIHPYIFDPELNLFIIQHIFNSVNDICQKNNIKIVNIFSYEEVNKVPLTIDVSNNTGTVLTGLADVSIAEHSTQDRKPRDPVITPLILNQHDRRFCHLNPHNNTALAHIIKDCIENNIPYIKLIDDPRFSYDIEHNRYLVTA